MEKVREKEKFLNLRTGLEERKNALRKTHSAISSLRVICFLTGFALMLIGINDKVKIALFLGVTLLLVFAFLVKKHIDTESLIEEAESRFKVVDKYVKRFDDQWRQFEEDGREFLSKDDYVSGDIDLLGPNSLYQMINVCHTKEGREKFAKKLSGQYPDPMCLSQRNDAIKELAEKEDFFIDFEAAGIRLENNIRNLKNRQLEVLDNSNEKYQVPAWFRFVRIILPLIEMILVCLSLFEIVSWAYPLISFLAILIFTWIVKPITDNFILSFYMIGANSASYLEMLKIINNSQFTSILLKEMSDKIGQENGCIKAFEKLKGINQAYNISFNPLVHLLFSGLFVWDVQLACIINKWRKKYGENILSGINCISDIEELLCLSVLPRVRETNFAVVKESDSGKSYIECDNLYHPLINPERVVSNSASFSGGITIITGSNMSGKTTFLRTVAINLVLAYLGAPVCGERLCANVMRIFTSMRVTDDVANGISTFYAEILRIKAMATYREKNLPMLCLIDEIFKGTNSADRIVGATEAITRISGEKCITIVSTHDFELGQIKDKNNRPAINYHFEEYYKDDELCFDYKIKDGICTTTNARAILRMAGFEV